LGEAAFSLGAIAFIYNGVFPFDVEIWGVWMWIIQVNEFRLERFAFSALSEATAYDELLGACHMSDPCNVFTGKEF